MSRTVRLQGSYSLSVRTNHKETLKSSVSWPRYAFLTVPKDAEDASTAHRRGLVSTLLKMKALDALTIQALNYFLRGQLVDKNKYSTSGACLLHYSSEVLLCTYELSWVHMCLQGKRGFFSTSEVSFYLSFSVCINEEVT